MPSTSSTACARRGYRRNDAPEPSAKGLCRVKTLARHDGVELCSHWPTVRPPRARLASRGPRVESRRNQQTPGFMHFRCVAHVRQSILVCTHRLRDLMASWNRILPAFDPYTFLHSQGHKRTSAILLRNVCFAAEAPFNKSSDISFVPKSVGVVGVLGRAMSAKTDPLFIASTPLRY